jgi:hypothetical protein
MDKPGLVTSTGPARMDHLFAECVRKALASAPADYLELVHADCEIEYVFDGKLIPESKVFGTDSQKGN